MRPPAPARGPPSAGPSSGPSSSSRPGTPSGPAPPARSDPLDDTDDPLTHLVFEALMKLRMWLAQHDPRGAKVGEATLPTKACCQLAR